MRKLLAVAAAVVLTGGVILADLPPPTEEQIEAKLKEARKKVEAAQAEERALAKRLEEARQEARGHIKAEVAGVLCWRDEGGGYYVRVRPKNDPKQETRVWLVFGEDKVTGRDLEELKGKEVVVKGSLGQRLGSGWWVPSGGLYLEDFKVERAGPDKDR
jgi:hypothetical protein